MTTEKEIPNLQIVADRLALQDLVQKYSRAIDRRDFALLRTLYHEDAIEDHGGMFSGPPQHISTGCRGRSHGTRRPHIISSTPSLRSTATGRKAKSIR